MLLDHDTTTRATTDATAVAAAVSALGPLDREALLLRLGGRTIDEVAAATGTTSAMVRVRLHRAATAVERRVGTFPVDGVAVPGEPDRTTDDVVTDAEVGITPLLHARLVRALRHSRTPSGPRFRGLASLLQRASEHTHQLTALGSAAGMTLAAVMAVAGAS